MLLTDSWTLIWASASRFRAATLVALDLELIRASACMPLRAAFSCSTCADCSVDRGLERLDAPLVHDLLPKRGLGGMIVRSAPRPRYCPRPELGGP